MELKEALKAKTITEVELAVISRNIQHVPEKDIKRLGLEKQLEKFNKSND